MSKCEWDELRAWRGLPQGSGKRERELMQKASVSHSARLRRFDRQWGAERVRNHGTAWRSRGLDLNGRELDESER